MCSGLVTTCSVHATQDGQEGAGAGRHRPARASNWRAPERAAVASDQAQLDEACWRTSANHNWCNLSDRLLRDQQGNAAGPGPAALAKDHCGADTAKLNMDRTEQWSSRNAISPISNYAPANTPAGAGLAMVDSDSLHGGYSRKQAAPHSCGRTACSVLQVGESQAALRPGFSREYRPDGSRIAARPSSNLMPQCQPTFNWVRLRSACGAGHADKPAADVRLIAGGRRRSSVLRQDGSGDGDSQAVSTR